MPECVCRLDEVRLPVAGRSPCIDWQVERGEVWLVDGAVGAGKTTLIKLLTGLIKPAAGRVSLFGADIHRLPQRKLARLRERLGVVLERDGLIASWSVGENLMLPLRWRGTSDDPGALERRIAGELGTIGESPALLGLRVSQLTARRRRRIALLRALLQQPQLLLLDDLPLYLPADEPDTPALLRRLIGQCETVIACAPAAWARRFHLPQTHVALLRSDAFEVLDADPPRSSERVAAQ